MPRRPRRRSAKASAAKLASAYSAANAGNGRSDAGVYSSAVCGGDMKRMYVDRSDGPNDASWKARCTPSS